MAVGEPASRTVPADLLSRLRAMAAARETVDVAQLHFVGLDDMASLIQPGLSGIGFVAPGSGVMSGSVIAIPALMARVTRRESWRTSTPKGISLVAL